MDKPLHSEEWSETYRGAVNPGDCDTSEHMNIASYFDRFTVANHVIMDRIRRLTTEHSAVRATGTTLGSADVRFLGELRTGDVLHVESALVGVSETELHIAHRVLNSESGLVATTTTQVLRPIDPPTGRPARLTSEQVAELTKIVTILDEEPYARYEEPDGADPFPTSVLDSPQRWEADSSGTVATKYYVSRFSDATLQALSSIGMTTAFRQKDRRGFSTFEMQLRMGESMTSDQVVRVRSTVRHLGRSSIRLLHRMSDVRSGALIAEVSQFGVNLDLDTRRPAEIPDSVRRLARSSASPAV